MDVLNETKFELTSFEKKRIKYFIHYWNNNYKTIIPISKRVFLDFIHSKQDIIYVNDNKELKTILSLKNIKTKKINFV